ncbi:hypothetical protein [Cohnella massiliensis]|uniref:hypothetical protein n=1 Tax=Cohnella massiliensis TaxID=1816691 RepID=UPI001FE30153|nr:hypothetical protein [Cohnella massiliensis]
MELKKSMRGLREVERKIEQVEKNAVEAAQANEGVATDTSCVRTETIASEAQVAKGYVAAVRALLLEDGEPPLKLPGMLIYERAQAIQASLVRCLTKKRASSPPRSGQNFQQT